MYVGSNHTGNHEPHKEPQWPILGVYGRLTEWITLPQKTKNDFKEECLVCPIRVCMSLSQPDGN